MTTFTDGPAAGATLPLRRAPMFLRAVRSRNGKWDALDQLDDAPAATETIHVYILKAKPSYMHLCMRGKGKAGSGWYAMAEYVYLPEQPLDECMRSDHAWQAWTLANKHLVAHLTQEQTEPEPKGKPS